jgi:hypothetical protein
MNSCIDKRDGGYEYEERVLVDYSVQTWISALTGSAAVGLIGI